MGSVTALVADLRGEEPPAVAWDPNTSSRTVAGSTPTTRPAVAADPVVTPPEAVVAPGTATATATADANTANTDSANTPTTDMDTDINTDTGGPGLICTGTTGHACPRPQSDNPRLRNKESRADSRNGDTWGGNYRERNGVRARKPGGPLDRGQNRRDHHRQQSGGVLYFDYSSRSGGWTSDGDGDLWIHTTDGATCRGSHIDGVDSRGQRGDFCGVCPPRSSAAAGPVHQQRHPPPPPAAECGRHLQVERGLRHL